MKHLFILASLILILSSCSDNDTPLFVVENQVTFTVPAGLNTIESHFFVLNNVPTFFDGFSTSDTSAISLITARRATVRPAFNVIDLDYINSINIFILDPEDNNNRIEIFFRENIPFGQKEEIDMLSSIRNVKEHLIKDRMNLEVVFNFRQIPIQTIDFRIDMSFSALGFE